MSKTQHFFTQDRKTCVATLDVVFIAMAVVVVVVVVVFIVVVVVVVVNVVDIITNVSQATNSCSIRSYLQSGWS